MGLSSSLKSDTPNQAQYSLGGGRVIAWKPESPLHARAHVERLIDGSARNVNVRVGFSFLEPDPALSLALPLDLSADRYPLSPIRL
jgi:hypothetical protein